MSAPDAPPHDAPPHDAPSRRVRRRRLTPAGAATRPWLRAATLAAAATIGALIGFGIADGASLARLGVVTLRLRGLPEFVSPDRGAVGAALLGGVHVMLVSGLWGAGVGAAGEWLGARGVRATTRVVALVGLGLLLALGDGVLPRPLRLAAGALSTAERGLVALLILTAAWGALRMSDTAELPPP